MYGDQPLENATVQVGGRQWPHVSTREALFGIREVTSELTREGHRLFRVNGKPILIKGGGWSPDMLLRDSQQTGLCSNSTWFVTFISTRSGLRARSRVTTSSVLADDVVNLVFAGWCCCDYWEKWSEWSTRDIHIAAASLESQVTSAAQPSQPFWVGYTEATIHHRQGRTPLPRGRLL